jgi:hypothetical protein
LCAKNSLFKERRNHCLKRWYGSANLFNHANTFMTDDVALRASPYFMHAAAHQAIAQARVHQRGLLISGGVNLDP